MRWNQLEASYFVVPVAHQTRTGLTSVVAFVALFRFFDTGGDLRALHVQRTGQQAKNTITTVSFIRKFYRQIVEFTLCLPIMARDVSLFSLIVYSLSSVHSLLSSTQLYTRLKPMFLWAVVLANNFQLPALTHSSVCICTKKHMAKWHWKYILYNSIYNVQIGCTLHKVNMEFWHQSLATTFGSLCSGWGSHFWVGAITQKRPHQALPYLR